MLLLAKIVFTPILVSLVTVVGWRLGPRAGGVLAGLPLASGPVAALLVWQHGVAFGRAASEGILLGVLAAEGFVAAYALLARRSPWPVCLAGGLGAFASLAGLAAWRSPPPTVAAPLVLAGVAGLALLLRDAPAGRIAQAPPSRWDLPVRALLTTALVVGITAAAPALGPHLSGVIAPVPVVTAALAVYAQRADGGDAARALLRGVTGGLISFWAFFAVLVAALGTWAPGASFAAASAVALALQAARMAAARTRPAPARTGAMP